METIYNAQLTFSTSSLNPSHYALTPTFQVYSCETGNILLSHHLPSPALAVATVVTEDNHRCILLAVTGGTIHRWCLPSLLTTAAANAVGGWGRRHNVVATVGEIRTAAALPIDCTPTAMDSAVSGVVLSSSSEALPLRPPDLPRAGGLPPRLRKINSTPTPTTIGVPTPLPTSAVPGWTAAAADEGRRRRQLVILAGERGLVAIDAERGALVSELAGHEGGVSHVAITPNGKAIVSVGEVCVVFLKCYSMY